MKNIKSICTTLLVSLLFIFTACEKEESNSDSHDSHDHANCCSDDHSTCCAAEARMALVEEGYSEVEVNPIVKEDCYYSEWDKTVSTPVSGLFEYFDANGNWVASIDFGDGACDEWVTKTWDVNIFPDYPEGSEVFSMFKTYDKGDKEDK